jgi:hypothetical protein
MRRDRSSGGKWQMADGLRGSPVPRMQSTLRRRVEKVQQQGSRGAGRWGHSSPSAAKRLENKVVELSRAQGQKGLPVSLRVMHLGTCRVQSTKPATTEPIPARQALFLPTSTTPLCGMRDALWLVVCESAALFPPPFRQGCFPRALLFLLRRSLSSLLGRRPQKRPPSLLVRPISLSLCREYLTAIKTL